jgi:dienelactone hydrolase
MPKTPFEAKIEHLNKFNMYVTDTSNWESLDPSYLLANYLENYISRAKLVINFLYRQKWVDKKRIVLLGHSQGAKVSVEASVNNRKVYKVGFLSGNPFGRTEQYIRLERYSSMIGQKQPAESQLEINRYYEVWKDIIKHPSDPEVKYGDPNITWKTFNKSQLENLLKLKVPIYVAYGTEDYKAIMCDLLPIHFISAGNTNLTLKAYVGLEHNFMEIDKARKPIYSKIHWQEVMDEFIKWVESKP